MSKALTSTESNIVLRWQKNRRESDAKNAETLADIKFLINPIKKGSFFKYNKCLIITLTVKTKDKSEGRWSGGRDRMDETHKMCFVVNNEETIDIIHQFFFMKKIVFTAFSWRGLHGDGVGLEDMLQSS